MGGILGEGAANHRLDAGRDARIEGAHRGWFLAHVRTRDREQVALEGDTPGEQLIRHDCKRILIAGGRKLTAELLRGHVGEGAGDDGAVRARSLGARHAEVGQQHPPVASRLDADEDVGGLHVAMHDAAVVAVLQRRGDLRENIHRAVERDWQPQFLARAAMNGVGERAFLGVEHDDVEIIALDATAGDRQDVGMIEGREQGRLALEASRHLTALGVREGTVARAHDLERDEVVAGGQLLAEIHHTHAALAELANQLATAELVPFQA